ncbi:MAG: DUF2970 domain-containing protein [Pseudomonadales bacterium]|nr:DUF2970 domain-containing protein [Pseudomonadales bacterium]
MKDETSKKRSSIFQAILSVFAAGVGIQSNKNREQDFNEGNFKTTIFAGLIGVVIFISVLVAIVTLVLDKS